MKVLTIMAIVAIVAAVGMMGATTVMLSQQAHAYACNSGAGNSGCSHGTGNGNGATQRHFHSNSG